MKNSVDFVNVSLNSVSRFLVDNFSDNLECFKKDFDVYLHNAVFIDKIKDSIKNKDVIVYGSSPSLNYFDSNKFFSDDAIHMGVNGQINNKNLNLDYFFAGDYVPICKNNITAELLKEKESKGTRICITRKVNVDPLNPKSNRFIPDSFLRELDGCANMLFYTNDYVEAVQKNYLKLLFSSYSIGQIPLLISLFCGAARIYLVGFDQGGAVYADGRSRGSCKVVDIEKSKASEDFAHNKTPSDLKAIKGYKQVKKIRKELNLKSEVISVNPVNMKGIFSDVYTSEFVTAKGLSVDDSKLLKPLA